MVTKIYNGNSVAAAKDGVIYFDIETTGFDKVNDKIMLISYGRFDRGEFVIKQIFADSLSEEKELLELFVEDIADADAWCSYNGIAFDEPFIRKKLQMHGIESDLPAEHVDLYRLIRPYHKSLGMERCNLKTVEKFLGINRMDTIDGGLSVGLYNQYLDTADQELKRIIMLHNYEDVLNLPEIHKFAARVMIDSGVARADCITAKQSKYLEALLHKNSIDLNTNISRLSKKAASKMIDRILNGCMDSLELEGIAQNSY
ncbi:MAG: polymerase [Firmicutes bacterium]|nr:polymerase [Bacillota bacterium]